MIKTFNYKTALLNLFIKSLGDGFSKIICKYYVFENMTPNNFKQVIRRMNAGDYAAYREISFSLKNCVKIFTEATYKIYNSLYNGGVKECITDTFFCPKYASDKYYFNFGEFFDIFKWGADVNDDFFYEIFEDVLSYIIAKNFYLEQSCDDYVIKINNEEAEDFLKRRDDEYSKGWYTREEYEFEKRKIPQKFRSEYNTSLIDVRYNKKQNKTFFKWVIDEFYHQIGNNTKADSIIKFIFGENDGSISTTFEKLKYESGKRSWSTFESLFENEQNDADLMELLKNDEDLAAYQIFQSRMFVAYFLENLCAELPKFVGEKNSTEIIKIITGDVSRKMPDDFLIPNHKEKTESYKDAVFNIIHAKGDFESVLQKMKTLDEDCPATETIKSYCSLLHPRIRQEMAEGEIKNAFKICEANCNFLFNFANYVELDLNGVLWRSESLYF